MGGLSGLSALSGLKGIMGGAGFIPSDIPQSEADALIWLYDNTAGPSWTTKTGWLSDPVVNSWHGVTVTGGHVTTLNLGNNNLNGSVASWAIDDLPNLLWLILQTNASMSGDISGWVLPNATAFIYMATTGISGDISAWTLAAGVNTLQIQSTSLSGAPDISANVSMSDYKYLNCALSQADVDAILLGIYNRRASFTNATPALNIGGTNSAPSGVYQDGDPPTTGKEYIYELVNDPESEGFNKWTITYTA